MHYESLKTPIIRRDASCREGYTLLELTLVLAVLIVLASIIWPRVERLMNQQALRHAADDVSVHLAAARMRAIDTGLVYQFRFEVGGRRYEVIPAELPNANAGSSCPTLSAELPEETHFALFEEKSTSSGGTTTAGLPAKSADDWSAPVLFLPDGSAVDACFDVVDDEDAYIHVSVRGLTGGVRVDDLAWRAKL